MKEWANEELGGRDNGEGAIGVRKLISIHSRETVKKRTDLKHIVYENLKILHKFCQILYYCFL